MEKKTFKIIKNMLLPIKSTIEIGPEGIVNKGKFVRWQEIVGFSYHIDSVNRAMNYIIAYDDKNGKGHTLNFIVTIAGSKKKKALFAEIYQMFHEGITKHHILPKSQEYINRITEGEEICLAGATLSNKGIEISLGLRKKEKLFIPKDQIEILHYEGTGGFRVSSLTNKKHYEHFFYSGTEVRYLLAVLERMFPEQACVYF